MANNYSLESFSPTTGFNLSGMTWDDFIRQAAGAASGRPVMEDSRFNGGLNIGGQNYDANYAYQAANGGRPTGTQGADAPHISELGGTIVEDPTDDDYHYVFYRNPDGSVGQQRRKGAGNWDFVKDMAGFIAGAGLMGAGIGAFGGAGSGAGAAGTGAGWTSGYDLAMGPDLLSMTGAGAGGVGSGLSSGAGSASGSGASGAGEFAANPTSFSDARFAVDTAIDPAYVGSGTATPTLHSMGNAISNALSGASNFMGNPLVQVGTSLVSGFMGDRASKRAADAQAAASEAAIAEQRRQYDQTRTDLAPWRERGVGASNRLATMMGLSGDATDPNFNKGYQTAPRYTPNPNAMAMQQNLSSSRPSSQNRLASMLSILNQRAGVR